MRARRMCWGSLSGGKWSSGSSVQRRCQRRERTLVRAATAGLRSLIRMWIRRSSGSALRRSSRPPPLESFAAIYLSQCSMEERFGASEHQLTASHWRFHRSATWAGVAAVVGGVAAYSLTSVGGEKAGAVATTETPERAKSVGLGYTNGPGQKRFD